MGLNRKSQFFDSNVQWKPSFNMRLQSLDGLSGVSGSKGIAKKANLGKQSLYPNLGFTQQPHFHVLKPRV